MTTLYKVNGDFLVGTPATMADGTPFYAPVVSLVDSTGVTVGGTAVPFAVQGNVASGVADSGNPIKGGGYASGTAPTAVTAAQRVNLWLGLNGQTIVGGTTFAGADATSNTLVQMTIAGGGAGHQSVAGFLHNGATWDRATKSNATSRIASAAATTNATVAKASAGNIHSIAALNVSAAAKFLKIYNKATAPTVGTDTPILTFAIPTSPGTLTINFPNGGHYLATGISYAITGLAPDADTTALAAGDVVGLNITYS